MKLIRSWVQWKLMKYKNSAWERRQNVQTILWIAVQKVTQLKIVAEVLRKSKTYTSEDRGWYKIATRV